MLDGVKLGESVRLGGADCDKLLEGLVSEKENVGDKLDDFVFLSEDDVVTLAAFPLLLRLFDED